MDTECSKRHMDSMGENLYVGDYADEITIDLKEKLGLDLDHKFLTLKEIRKIIGSTKRSSYPQGY
ncbi:MAG: hypothetical protein M1280_04550 [Actinobacteria bacterium]|nr:hypothetical protein [Actinomycetota bacterium]